MYRDDLEAALARNSVLERELRELRQAVAPPPPFRTIPVPPPPRREPARPPCNDGARVGYVRPARYFPAFAAFAVWARAACSSLRDHLGIETPGWWTTRSDVLLLDLLRWPLILLSIPIVMVLQLLVVVAYASFLAVAFPVVGLATIAISIVGAPVIAAASIRRWRSGAPPAGLAWGAVVSPEGARVYAACVLCVVVAFVPLLVVVVAG